MRKSSRLSSPVAFTGSRLTHLGQAQRVSWDSRHCNTYVIAGWDSACYWGATITILASSNGNICHNDFNSRKYKLLRLILVPCQRRYAGLRLKEIQQTVSNICWAPLAAITRLTPPASVASTMYITCKSVQKSYRSALSLSASVTVFYAILNIILNLTDL